MQKEFCSRGFEVNYKKRIKIDIVIQVMNILFFIKCLKLSEQQLVDCDNEDGGCNGGDYMTAWDYLQKSGGSAQQSLYRPYNARVFRGMLLILLCFFFNDFHVIR